MEYAAKWRDDKEHLQGISLGCKQRGFVVGVESSRGKIVPLFEQSVQKTSLVQVGTAIPWKLLHH